jgi:hypothetical protein
LLAEQIEVNPITPLEFVMMYKKYTSWYNGLSPVKQLAVSFALYWFYWFIAWLIVEQFLFKETRGLPSLLFRATWMAFLMTMPYHWKTLKKIFKSQKETVGKNVDNS